jgi:hypothetical protein
VCISKKEHSLPCLIGFLPCRCLATSIVSTFKVIKGRNFCKTYHICKSEACASHCVWGGQHLPILPSQVLLKWWKKKTRKLFYNICQRLVKHKSASHFRKRWLAPVPQFAPKKETGHRVTIRKLENCFLSLLRPFKLKQGMSHAFSASKYVKIMFIFIILVFLTPFKPHNS